ncbi:MAG: type IV toxin-antitoxin system AbiEi family antitoxin domain-containing protein [Hyphomicrobiaceae bacterium]
MTKQTSASVNWLERHLPEGILVDSGWLSNAGFSSSLRTQYVSAGRLEQPARRVYRRPRGSLDWQQVVISLQTLLGHDLLVGGRSALDLLGFSHYVEQTVREIYLYGPKPPPTWLATLPLPTKFIYRNDARLFETFKASTAPHSLTPDADRKASRREDIATQSWGPWRWPLMHSSPERAFLELLYEIPDGETFHNADMVMEGLSTLSPAKLQALLADCHNVKVKRLFFFFADRHQHAWLKRIDRKAVDLGRGKRMIAKGGRYEKRYLITVPGDLDGPH